MAEQNTILSALDQAFQLHESEIVIELGPDRILQFIGVRLVIILAIAVKLTELVVGNLTCHPVRNETGYSADFIKFTETYCWESPIIPSQYYNSGNEDAAKLCNTESEVNEELLLSRANAAINVMRWMPYALLLQAFLFSLPSAAWHLRVGGRLMGHLRFMKLFIQQIYEDVKDLPAGIYKKDDYYDGSSHIDGWRKASASNQDSNEIVYTNETPGVEQKVNNIMNKVRGATLNLTQQQSTEDEASSSEQNHNEESNDSQPNILQTDESKLLDRHLFSMLCFENFSSMEQYPYLLSIFRLTFCAKFVDEDGIYPMNQAILRQWCHQDNFSGRFLVIRYYLKHVFGIILSLSAVRAMAFIFEILGSEIWESENFRCTVLYYEDELIVCTLHRKTEMLAFLIMNCIIIIIYLIISSVHLYFTTRSRYRETSLFFEHINDLGSVGMLARLREKQDKERKKRNS